MGRVLSIFAKIMYLKVYARLGELEEKLNPRCFIGAIRVIVLSILG